MGPLLRFGLPYQSQGLLHLAFGRIIPALGGLILTGAQVGYLTWAQDVARWPRIPADYVARVGFPAFARIQADKAAFSRLIEQALTLVSAITFPAALIGAALAPALIEPVFGSGWKPAGLPLTVFLVQTPFDALAVVLLPVIYASGDARRGLLISLAWAILAWALCGLAVIGAPGVLAIPIGLTGATLVMSAVIARSLPDGITIRWWPAVIRPLLIAVGLGVCIRLIMGGIL
jgi:O-antigen/teichoic acid export membrane protein